MSKKKVTVTVRPELPSFNKITEDIMAADDDDIIFTVNKEGE